ncbi:MAG: ankyrin repeat domain-containing protein, partial [Bacteriovoracales bacterium]
MKAVISGKISEVKKLIEKGADVNFLGQCDQPFVNYKCTALYSAIHAGNFDIAKLLLEEG